MDFVKELVGGIYVIMWILLSALGVVLYVSDRFDDLKFVICLIVFCTVSAVIGVCASNAISKYKWNHSNAKKEYETLTDDLRHRYETLTQNLKTDHNSRMQLLEKEYQEKNIKFQSDKELFFDIMEESRQTYPALARIFSDYEYVIARSDAEYLQFKSRPALKAAETVREYGRKNKVLKQQIKELEYQLSFWENLFPWLEDFREADVKEILNSKNDIAETEYDAVKKWLSPVEYNSLSTAEKYQLALDRYKQRKNKSNWEIGIEYERYIGYQFESKGFVVEYRGALDGLQDMGRDLIVTKEKKKCVVQCKYWNSNKTIHEKHIFQLFGSTVLLKLQNKEVDIKGIFITSTQLSDIARSVAKALNIKVFENVAMSYDYPCIKCNINTSTGEKIYHLPFDQQYDRCVIKNSGEFYAMTVQEAEDQGFRRAHKWQQQRA